MDLEQRGVPGGFVASTEFVEAARAFAERLLRTAPKDSQARLQHAFRLALSRPPTAEETDLLSNLLSSQAAHYQNHPSEAEKLVRTGQAPVASDLDPVQWAAWTAVTRALLNLDETITRH